MDLIDIFNTFSIGCLCYTTHKYANRLTIIERDLDLFMNTTTIIIKKLEDMPTLSKPIPEQPVKKKVAEQITDHEQRIEMLEMQACGNEALEGKVRRAMNKMMDIEIRLNTLKIR